MLAMGVIAASGCGARVDARWQGMPDLADVVDTEQDAEIQGLLEHAAAQPDSIDAQRALVDGLRVRGRFGEAVVSMGSVIRLAPDDAVVAELLVAAGRLFPDAPPVIGAICQDILAENPDNLGALTVMGRLLLAENRPIAAERALSEAWESGARQWRLAELLARVEIALDYDEEAARWLAEATRAAPETPGASMVLARAYSSIDDPVTAQRLARAAVALAPDQPEVYVTLGAVLLDSELPAQAATTLERALSLAAQIDPPDSSTPQASTQNARWLLGRAYRDPKLGRFAEARELLEKATAASWGGKEPPLETYADLAIACQNLGDTEAAIDAHKRVVNSGTGRFVVAAYNDLAYLYADSGQNLAEALELAQLAVGFAPGPSTWDTLGWVYYQMGQYPEAARYLEMAVEKAPSDKGILGHLELTRRRLEELE